MKHGVDQSFPLIDVLSLDAGRAGPKLVQITIRAMRYNLRLRRSLCGKAVKLSVFWLFEGTLFSRESIFGRS
jgi:hypothetical protein